MSAVALILVAAAQQNAFAAGTPLARQSEKEMLLLYHAYGNCVVNLFARRAAKTILENVDDETLIKRRPEMVEPDCVKPPSGTSMFIGLQADRVRYAVADALVRKELAAQQAPDLTTVPPLDHHHPGQAPARITAAGKQLTDKEYQEKLRAYQVQYAFSQFSRFGECVVRANAAGARAILLTVPDSPEEGSAFAQLKPAFASCLPKGETMKLTKLPLRGTVAVNYYRLAKAALGASAAGGTR